MQTSKFTIRGPYAFIQPVKILFIQEVYKDHFEKL